MYPSTFNADFPTGPGFDWTPTNNFMEKKLMTKLGVSKVSLEWLEFMNTDERFINRSGDRVKIQHAWNKGEKMIGNYCMDGFCQVDDMNYCLKFQGCYFHGCDDCNFLITLELETVNLILS